MTVFQVVIIGTLAALILSELVRGLRSRLTRSALVRLFVWSATAAAVYMPDGVSRIAQLTGIDRGADLVTYCFVLAYLGTTFYFYSRYVRLRQQLTELVRHQALREADSGHH